MTFQELGLVKPLLKALDQQGYTHPTPIQQQAIPIVLKGHDLLGVAQTGTGKTAAFALPILQRLEASSSAGYRHIRCLILTPTRELAAQIGDSFADYGKHMGLKHEVIFGGVSQHPQTIALRNGTDILIATPGRLLDLMNQGYIYLDYLEVFVLDEADRMLDMGFIHDVRKVVRELPKQRQTLFFSATMPPEIAKLADMILHNPEKVEVTPVSSTAEKVAQQVYFVDKKSKLPLLLHILKEQKIKRTLVFARTKHGADRVAKDLNKNKVNAGAIHGDKSQNARQAALNAFKDGKLQVLVATDIAARGIDIDNLTHVINYDLSNVPETYVHRIGRTGRAGADGMAISFCDREERAYLRDIVKLTKQQIPVVDNHPFVSHAAESAPAEGETKAKARPSRNRNNQQQSRRRNDQQGNRRGNHHGRPRPAGQHSQQQGQATSSQ